jgi:hypothetical protein
MFNLEEKKNELSEKFTHLVSYKNKTGFFNGKNYGFLFPTELSKILLYDEDPNFSFDNENLIIRFNHIPSDGYITFLNYLSELRKNDCSFLGRIKRLFGKNKKDIKARFFQNVDSVPYISTWENVVLTKINNEMIFDSEKSDVNIHTTLTFKFSRFYNGEFLISNIGNLNIDSYKEEMKEKNKQFIEESKNEQYVEHNVEELLNSETVVKITSDVK